jgi:WD40 repeat protein
MRYNVHTIEAGVVTALYLGGSILNLAMEDNSIHVYSVKAMPPTLVHSLIGHTARYFGGFNWNSVTALASVNDLVFSASIDSSIRLWSVDGKCVRMIMTPSPVTDIYVSTKILISVGRSLLVWNIVDGRLIVI